MAPVNYDDWILMTRTYAICALFLFVKYLFSLMYGANPGNHPEEDAFIDRSKEHQRDIRKERQFMNDSETIPISLAIFFFAFLLQCFENAGGISGSDGTITLTVMIILYTISRYGFTFCYIFRLSPWRSIFWTFSIISTVIASIMSCISAFNIDYTLVFK